MILKKFIHRLQNSLLHSGGRKDSNHANRNGLQCLPQTAVTRKKEIDARSNIGTKPHKLEILSYRKAPPTLTPRVSSEDIVWIAGKATLPLRTRSGRVA